jgi:hypothetical protein
MHASAQILYLVRFFVVSQQDQLCHRMFSAGAMEDDGKTFKHQPEYLQRFDLIMMDIPDISHIPPTKNTENLYIPAAEDWEERELEWIQLTCCPVPTKNGGCCKKEAFKKAMVWSMYGHLSMFSYLMQHLIHSRNHQLSPSDAYDAILNSVVSETIKPQYCKYDWQEREIYRAYADEVRIKALDAPKRKKQKRGRGSATPLADDEASDASEGFPFEIQDGESTMMPDGSFEHADQQAALSMQGIKLLVARTVKQTVQAMAQGACSAKGGKADKMGNVKNLPLSKLRMVQDSLTRAEWAVCTSLISHATTAKKLEAERQTLSSTVALLSEFTGDQDRTMSSTSNMNKTNQLSLSLG